MSAVDSISMWMRAEQLPLARAVLSAVKLNCALVGSPEAGRAVALASALGGKPADDLRAALASSGQQSGIFLLLDTGELLRNDRAGPDAEALRVRRVRHAPIISIEPLPASLAELRSSTNAMQTQPPGPPVALDGPPDSGFDSTTPVIAPRVTADIVTPAALGRLCRPLADLGSLITEFGPARSASIMSTGCGLDGSLGARLFDAMDLACSLFGEAEFVDAGYGNPSGHRGLSNGPFAAQAAHGLRRLTGDLACVLRWTGGRTATIFVSDSAGPLTRRVMILGPSGLIETSDHTLAWRDSSGTIVKHPSRADRAPASVPFDVAAESLSRLISELAAAGTDGGSGPPEAAPEVTVDYPATLAMCEAALLSVRTGQPESPALLRHAAR